MRLLLALTAPPLGTPQRVPLAALCPDQTSDGRLVPCSFSTTCHFRVWTPRQSVICQRPAALPRLKAGHPGLSMNLYLFQLWIPTFRTHLFPFHAIWE